MPSPRKKPERGSMYRTRIAAIFVVILALSGPVASAQEAGSFQIGFRDFVVMSNQQLLILQNDFLLRAGLQHRLGSLQRAAIFQVYVAENDLGVFLAEAPG
jgi:ABC-type maltose transport system permease subunit